MERRSTQIESFSGPDELAVTVRGVPRVALPGVRLLAGSSNKLEENTMPEVPTVSELVSEQGEIVPAVQAEAAAEALAAAEVDGSSIDGPITRHQIMVRLQFWVDRHYVYNTNKSDEDAAGTLYRDDCSGLVSMAWHLGHSWTTAQFVDTSGRWPWGALAGVDQLQPGDALVRHDNSVQHIKLFHSWVDAHDHKKGGHFFSFNHTGETVRNPHAPDNKGKIGRDGWSEIVSYKAIRYTRVA